ncbi:MAG: chemotaxis protein CheD [Armatimonadota bacterium]|nr:chemotaxis protein CheD [Armatimonadota bacterium]
MAQGRVLLAGMGEIVVARSKGVVGCIGLGSCVGTLLFDPRTHAVALAHVMLPDASEHDAFQQPGKYATTAVPALLRALDVPPAFASRLRAILIGGGELFKNRCQTLRIGERNVETLYRLLHELRIPIVYEQTRGDSGRSFEFDVETGYLQVRTVGSAPIEQNLAAVLGIACKVA